MTTFIKGRGRDKAIELLAIAAELGYGPEVIESRPTRNGYEVPDDVAERFEQSAGGVEGESNADGNDGAGGGGESGGGGEGSQADSGAQHTPGEIHSPEITPATGESIETGEEREVARADAGELDTFAPSTVVEAESDNREPAIPETTAVKMPKKNQSEEAWRDYAKTLDSYNEETDSELSRDELVAKFGD